MEKLDNTDNEVIDPLKGYKGADGQYYPWYDLNLLLSRHKAFNFDIGARGIGKTTSWSLWARKSWEINKARWAVVVRRPEELAITRVTFWEGLAGRGYEFKNEGIKNFIRPKRPQGTSQKAWNSEAPWQFWGVFLCLSDANRYKQASSMFSDSRIDKMLFDEFIIEDDSKRYLSTEPSPLFSIASSVFRNRPRRVHCFSNAGFVNNPYFRHFGLSSGDFTQSNFVKRGDDVLFHYSRQPSPEIYTTGLTSREKDYQVHNIFKDVTGCGVVKELPQYCIPSFNLNDKHGRYFIVYHCHIKGWLWVKAVRKPLGNLPMFNLDPYSIIVGGVYDNSVIKMIQKSQRAGRLRFMSDEARIAIFEVI